MGYQASLIGFLVKVLGTILGGRHARPALESPAECAQFREAQKESDFPQGVVIRSNISQSLVFAYLLNKFLKTEPFLFKPTIKSLPAHVALPGQGVCVNFFRRHLP